LVGDYTLNNRVPLTHEKLLSLLVDSVVDVLKQIDDQQKYLKKIKDNESLTKAHHTKRIIQTWFRANGNLPIPD
jgi:hypothetical protein